MGYGRKIKTEENEENNLNLNLRYLTQLDSCFARVAADQTSCFARVAADQNNPRGAVAGTAQFVARVMRSPAPAGARRIGAI